VKGEEEEDLGRSAMAAASTASTAIKRKIARLKREIERMDAFFYTNSPDDVD
jgi:predicted RNase H-like nuclease (RuvC/YqgF family)